MATREKVKKLIILLGGTKNQIMLGDVLEKITELSPNNNIWDKIDKTVRLWSNYDFKKPLNQIVKDSGFAFAQCVDPDCKCGTFPLRNDKCKYKSYLKDFYARNLCDYLCEIFLDKS